ncbi:hypothetical protein NHX12_003966, partial [Muraenolepis orangiensis]
MAVPMPSKRRSLVVQTSVDAYTPPDTSSGSEGDEVAVGDDERGQRGRRWVGRRPAGGDVTGYIPPSGGPAQGQERPLGGDRALGSLGPEGPRQTPKYGNAELMETGDGVPVSSRVSAKIQQLVNTLKRPKRPPLTEFFVDDFQELLEVQHPEPNQPKAEGGPMGVEEGEPLGVVTNWPTSLEAGLQRWGTISPKAPCLTCMDPNGKQLHVLTYGKLWSRSVKVAYNLLHKVALVYPNNDPAAFMTSFYGCLLAQVVPVPIEVPLSRKDAGSKQVGFLLGSCGVTLALTSDACHKGLPKTSTGETPQFKESKHLAKPPRDWYPVYKTCKDGGVLGVTVTRAAMLAHCQALTQACSYTEAETMVNVLDFKKDVGLWHAILTSVMNMMHVISVPYSLMKVNPLSWIQRVCQFKAKVACVKSRDMHWALVAHRDQRDVDLSSLRLLLVADGANPWSVSSCDAFLNVFQTKGLRSEVICPCASSTEGLTVAIRSEEKLSVLTLQDVGGVMPGAVMCVVRPEGFPQLCRTDEIGELCVSSVATGTAYYGLTGMTKNTFEVFPVSAAGEPVGERGFTRTGLLGFLGPGGAAFVAGKMDGLMVVGSRRHNADDLVATALAVEPMKFVYRGSLLDKFNQYFLTENVEPFDWVRQPFTNCSSNNLPSELEDALIELSSDRTLQASFASKTLDEFWLSVVQEYPGLSKAAMDILTPFGSTYLIAVFSITVLHDERVVVVAEQRPDSTEEDSFQWMSRVLQAIDGIHQVGVYCLALVPSNTLPKTPLGGLHLSETKQLFLEGALHPCNVLMCPHTCVTNMPRPRQKQPEVGPASVMVGNLVSGKRIAQASGRDLGHLEDQDQFLFLSDVLQWRSQTTPDHVLYTLLNSRGAVSSSLTCLQLHKRAEKISAMLGERGHRVEGDHVALVYPPGVDLIAAFYGCMYAGCVPVTVRPPHPQNISTTLPTVKMIVEVSRSVCVLTTQLISKLLKSKEASASVELRSWPPVLETDDLPKKKPLLLYKPSNPESLAYVDFSVSTTGMLAGVKMCHSSTSAFCRSIKLQCELYPSREVAICLDPYCGLGFLEVNPAVWLLAVSQMRVRDSFCSYSVMELSTKNLGLQTHTLKARGLDLSRVRTCVVVAEERPRTALSQSFSKLFKDLGLHTRAVSTSFGCRVNLAICLQPHRLGKLAEQGTSGPDPTTVYVDMRALRHDRVRLVERGSPHSLPLMESGK